MIIGLTGGIATGKSTVSRMLKETGIPVIDADAIAKEVVKPGETAYKKIMKHFGAGILHEDQTINRDKLGSIIFNDPGEREILNGIVHPEVRKEMSSQAEQLIKEQFPIVVMDIPLLIESNLFHLVDKVVLVYAPEHVQLARLMERNSYSEEEALSRISAQTSIEKKKNYSDYVIDNSGSLAETEHQLEVLLQALRKP